MITLFQREKGVVVTIKSKSKIGTYRVRVYPTII